MIYVNLIEISPVVIEIREVENDDLVVLVNNTLVWRTSLLAADTQPCVLIIYVGPLEEVCKVKAPYIHDKGSSNSMAAYEFSKHYR